MSVHTWILFCTITAISVASPGPAVLLSVTNSLMSGIRASLFSSLGNITGLFLVSGAAVLGLGAVLKTSVVLFGIFKFCGALYLIYLGLRQWLARPVTLATRSAVLAAKNREGASARFFIQGVLVAVSNPKAILFFTAFLPQFMDTRYSVFPQFLILTLTFMAFSFLSLMAWAWGIRRIRPGVLEGKKQRWMNRISGSVFIAFGIGMLGLKQQNTLA